MEPRLPPHRGPLQNKPVRRAKSKFVVISTKPDETFIPEQLPTTRRMAWMFGVTLGFLAFTAFILHGGISEQNISAPSFQIPWFLWLYFALWIVIVLEGLIGVALATGPLKPILLRFLLICLLPAFRLTISPQFANHRIWLPRAHWQPVGRATFDHLERKLALPMLLITLLILPVIGAELLLQERIDRSPGLTMLLHMTTAFIWFFFALEFILLVSATEKKLDYCKKHWINIIIILLPLIAFLRALQIFRFLRLTKASKLLRAYRLRGVFARTMRIVLMLNLLERLMQRNPEKYLAHLEEKIQEKETELGELRTKLQEAQERLASRSD
jgi:voltage-gated potassium channel